MFPVPAVAGVEPQQQAQKPTRPRQQNTMRQARSLLPPQQNLLFLPPNKLHTQTNQPNVTQNPPSIAQQNITIPPKLNLESNQKMLIQSQPIHSLSAQTPQQTSISINQSNEPPPHPQLIIVRPIPKLQLPKTTTTTPDPIQLLLPNPQLSQSTKFTTTTPEPKPLQYSMPPAILSQLNPQQQEIINRPITSLSTATRTFSTQVQDNQPPSRQQTLARTQSTKNSYQKEQSKPKNTKKQKSQETPKKTKEESPSLLISQTSNALQQFQISPQLMMMNPRPASPVTIDRGVLQKVFPRPVTPALNIDIAVPELYNDEGSNEKYGIRCVCDEQIDKGIMIQCENCMYWLHAACVNIARVLPNDKFLCPFCKKRPIRCSCGNAKKYDEPIIQCVKCKYWVHKSCANLGYGRNPPHFICSFCGGGNLSLPYYTLQQPLFKDFTVSIDSTDFIEIVEKCPPGKFRNFILADLNKKELHYNDTIARYFNAFAAPLFEEDIDFWSIFTSTLCEILQVDRKYLYSSIDNLAMQLMYEKTSKPNLFVALDTFTVSERTSILLQQINIPKYDKPLTPVKLKYINGGIHVESSVQDGGFICAIPGFMCHFFEAPCVNGIKPTYVSVPSSEFVIDTEGTGFAISQHIKRSFHYNCHPKLFNVKGEVKALLFAHNMKGPMIQKTKQRKGGIAIQQGDELYLPFDSDLPWPTPSDEWMDKTKVKVNERHSRRRNKEKKEKKDNSLLSVFYPVKEGIEMPVKVLSEKDMKDKEEDAIIKSSNKILTRRQVQISEEKNGN